MNKNFKILSSIAVAGIMATTSLTGLVSAVTTNDTTVTKSLGIYRKLVSGNITVPYVLKDRSDRVTIKDLKDEYETGAHKITKFNGSSQIAPDNTVVKTGDTFVVNGETYNVVVYGDVNADGLVDSSDALKILEHDAGLATISNKFVLESGDVARDSSVNSSDALKLLEYDNWLSEEIIDKTPVPEKEEEPIVSTNYSLELKEAKYINTRNQANLKMNIRLTKTLDKKLEGVTIELTDTKTGKVTVSAFDIVANRDLFEQSVPTCASLEDGDITVKLLDKDKNILAKTVIEKHTKETIAAKVTTKRVDSASATISIQGYGENQVAKMYYQVDGTEPTNAETLVTDKAANILTVSNNSATSNIPVELKTNTAHKVYYVLEDVYGNITALDTAVIAKENVPVAEAVKEIKETNGVFSWTGATGLNKIVTLYKGSEVVAIKTITADNIDLKTEMSKAAGDYKITVETEGATDGSTANSVVVSSSVVKVTALKTLTGVTLTMKEDKASKTDKVYLTWNNDNGVENVKYVYTLQKLDENGKYQNVGAEVEISGKANLEAKEKEITSDIEANEVYKVSIKAISTGTAVTANAEETVTDAFFRLDAGNFTPIALEATDTSVTLSVLKEVKVNGTRATYSAEVREVEEREAGSLTLGPATTKSASVVDGKIMINGLNAGKEYVVRIIATVSGITGKSAPIGKTDADIIKTYKTAPSLNKTLTVITDAKDKAENTLLCDANGVTIGNTNAIATSSTEYAPSFMKTLNVINNLKLDAGDTINVSGNTIVITLKGNSASSNVLTIGNDAKDMKFEVNGNGNTRSISVAAGEVSLKGNKARFSVTSTIPDAKTGKIILNTGVIVLGDATYTVAANSNEVTINGLKVSTVLETTMKGTKATKTLEITPNNAENTLVLENTKGTGDMTGVNDAVIKFVGDLTNKPSQRGTITIKTTDGKVTLAEADVPANVDSVINVEVNKGTVEITEPTYTGIKNITVSAEENAASTVNAIANIVAPVEMNNVELKDYTDDEIASEFSVSGKEIEKVREFINSFGINGKGAKITATQGNAEITITFEKPVSNVQIKGIK